MSDIQPASARVSYADVLAWEKDRADEEGSQRWASESDSQGRRDGTLARRG